MTTSDVHVGDVTGNVIVPQTGGDITGDMIAGNKAVLSGDGNINILGNLAIYLATRPIQPEPQPAAVDIGPNPYKELVAFTEADAGCFFGREKLIQKLWKKFRTLHEAFPGSPPLVGGVRGGGMPLRLLAILGPSGSGKSSVARAGLLPELARNPLPGIRRARVAVFTPGAHPLESLANIFARLAYNDRVPVEKSEEFVRVLQKPNDRGEWHGLRRIAGALPDIDLIPVIILIDQFEEVYALCSDVAERQQFINNLLHAAADASKQVSVILTLRSDFLGHTQSHPDFNHAIAANEIIVPVMDAQELHDAIGKPAAQAGRPLDEATIQLLIEQTQGHPGALPLLQFTLTRIWEGLAAGVAPSETLQQIGGVGGALADKAQEIYNGLPESQKAIARRAFLSMIHLGEGTQDTRRRVALTDIVAQGENPAEIHAVVYRFAQPGARLITLSGTQEDHETVEVTHEALFSHWGDLRQWLEDNREDVRFHRRLAEAAAYWEHQGRPDGLLWRSPDLDLLRQFQERAQGDMTPLQAAFFQASAALQAQEQAEKEAQRRRELEAAQKLAAEAEARQLAEAQARREAEQHTQTQIRAAQRLRTRLAVAIGFALLALITAGIAYYGFNQARRNAKTAEANAALARTNEAAAEEQKNKAFRTQSLFLADLARQENEKQNYTSATLLALEALPKSMLTPDRPYVSEAEFQLDYAITYLRERRILTGHTDRVFSAVFSSDGKRIVTASADHTARVWDTATGQEVVALTGHTNQVTSAVFSLDGTRIVTASIDGTARLWDVSAVLNTGATTGKELATLTGGAASVVSAVFSPDGTRIVTASASDTARVWDAATGQEVATLIGHTTTMTSAVFSPDGARIVTVFYNFVTAQLWDAATGKELATLTEGEDWVAEVNSVVFNPDGTRIVIASSDNKVWLWDVSAVLKTGVVTGKEKTSLTGHTDTVNSAVFSPDGTRILTASKDRTARLWDAATGEEVGRLTGHTAPVNSAVFSPNGALIVTASDDGTVRLWRLVPEARAGEVVATLIGHTRGVNSAVFSPDGTRIVTASDDGTARVWDVWAAINTGVAIGKEVTSLTRGTSSVRSAVFSPDGARIATASADHTARVWDAVTGKAVAVLTGHTDWVLSAVFSPDGTRIATASVDHTARVWDAATGQEVATLSGHTGMVYSAVFSPDGSRVVTAGRNPYEDRDSQNNMAIVWDAATGAALAMLTGHTAAVSSAVFSPDGAHILTTSDDNTARLWDTITGKEVARLTGHTRWVLSAVFSPDGALIVTVSSDHTARLWDAATGKEVAVLTGHTAPVTSAVFSPNGARILTASDDNTVRLWDVATGKEVAVLTGHTDKVTSVAFSPDGARIVTASKKDRTTRLWDAATRKEVRMLIRHRAPVNSAVFSPNGALIVTASDDGTVRLWRFSTQELIDYANSIVPRRLTPEERKQYFLE